MQHATERVERPRESQEALDGKKKVSSTGYHREGKQVESPNRRMIFFVRFEKDNIELKHNLNENSQTGV